MSKAKENLDISQVNPLIPFTSADTVLWKQGETVITVGHITVRRDLRISVVNTTSLFVNGTDTLYSGNYTCEVEWSPNPDDPPSSITHYLEVRVPASVYSVVPVADSIDRDDDGGEDGELPVVYAEEGSNATLECRAEGVPRPTVTWVSS